MAFTYDQFVSAANNAGLLNQFSQSDLALAQQYPDFGMSILELKKNYGLAGTDQERQAINTQANNLRVSYGNYTGGPTGGGYISTGLSPSDYNSQYKSLADSILSQMGNYGSFNYGAAEPTYTNKHKELLDNLLNEVVNREEFSYDPDIDPVWSAYKKQYRREGDRATANAMAQAAAMSGGMPSSYAVTAGSQAGDYYAGQLSDALATMYQQAYDRYLNEFSMDRGALSDVQTQEQMEYNKFLTDLNQYNTNRDFAYNDYLNQYNMLSNNLNAYQTQDQLEYNRLLDEINQGNAQAQNAAAQVEAMLAAGFMPSTDLLAQAQYSQEYANALAGYYGGGSPVYTPTPKDKIPTDKPEPEKKSNNYNAAKNAMEAKAKKGTATYADLMDVLDRWSPGLTTEEAAELAEEYGIAKYL